MIKQSMPEELSLDIVAKDVWAFMKQPKLDHLSSYFKGNPLQIFPYLLMLDFMIMITLIILSGIILALLGIEEMDHKIGDLADQPLKLAVSVVVLAPILEEAVFRLPMKYSYIRIFVPCCLVLAVLYNHLDATTIGWIAIVFFLLIALFHFIDQRNDNRLNLQMATLWEANFYIPFWMLTICFAFLHLTNFNSSFSWYLAPLLVLPQFVLGAMLGYIRTVNGFVYAVLFHALHNAITLVPILMFQLAPPST